MSERGEPATKAEMILELRKMLSPIVRTGAERDRRTQVFRQIIDLLQAKNLST